MKETYALLSNEPGEKEKIETILRIEPFLSLSEYVFRFIAQKDFKRIADHEEELNLLRKQLEADIHSNQLPPKTPHLRLQKLITVMIGQGRSLHEWIADIITYHKVVMDERFGHIRRLGNFSNAGSLKAVMGKHIQGSLANGQTGVVLVACRAAAFSEGACNSLGCHKSLTLTEADV
jgi:hypothetical protein